MGPWGPFAGPWGCDGATLIHDQPQCFPSLAGRPGSCGYNNNMCSSSSLGNFGGRKKKAGAGAVAAAFPGIFP